MIFCSFFFCFVQKRAIFESFCLREITRYITLDLWRMSACVEAWSPPFGVSFTVMFVLVRLLGKWVIGLLIQTLSHHSNLELKFQRWNFCFPGLRFVI